jgi:DNA-damage-inducible protein D
MSQIPHTSPFEAIRHKDEHTKEYWSAHELYKILGYSSSRALQNTVEKARIACENSKEDIFQHFYLQIDIVITGNGSLQKSEVYRLSRYACYLIIMNADPHKPIVALGQAYFAYEARRQEILDMLSQSSRPEDLKRDVMRFLLYTYDFKLQKAAQETRVVEPGDFAIFYDNSFSGLRK